MTRQRDGRGARLGLGMAVVLGGILASATSARAHEDPPGCSQTGPAIIMAVFRADGVTGLVGPVSPCETIKYKATLQKAADDDNICAFSGGTFKLTTPDGVAHDISLAVPCIGGQLPPCDPTVDSIASSLISYTVQPANIVGGFINANANYTGGVAHDNNPDTPGVSATSPKSTPVLSCSDNNLCTNDVCDPALAGSAACSNPPIVCSDNNICTSDACVEGQCQFTPNAPCTDNNICTTDTCDPITGCTFTPNAPCTDNNICTSDVCDPILGCVFTPNAPCTDNNICTTDTCDPITGCTFTPNAPCTDNNICTTDTCDPVTGCTFTPGAACTDNNMCTNEVCDPVTGCTQTGLLDCNDNNLCTNDICNPATGCVSTNIVCIDNNLCTADSCNPATGCVFTDTSPSCNDNNPCTDDTCVPAQGCVFTPNQNPQCQGLNHFQCYEIKPFAFDRIPGVTVQDQFGSTVLPVRTPHPFCLPSDKNGEDPDAATDPEHLMAFADPAPFVKEPNLTVTNQFGSVKIDVVRRKYLMVPTAKSLAGPVPALPVPTVTDHFQCYLVKRSVGSGRFVPKRGVAATDQFGPHSIDLLRPRYLCVPANKNNEDPTAPSHPQSLLCYKTRHRSRFGTKEIFTNNQFGPLQETLTRRLEFCVPSALGAPPDDGD